MTVDRRKEMRIPLFLQVGCQGLSDEESDFHKLNLNCHDLSSHGMALECERPMGMDETCCFSLPLFSAQKPLTVKGKVRWRKPLRDGSKIGVRFEEPIDLTLPFPLVKDAAARLQRDAEHFKASVRNVLSDACIWVNPAGEILQYDQRVLSLLNCSDLDVKDKRIFDFISPEDREGLEWISKKLKRSGDALPVKRVFRLRSNEGEETFCQFSIPAKPPWSGAIEIYLEDVTQAHRLEQQNLRLEEMVRTFSGCINGRMLVLTPDLTIRETRGRICGQSNHTNKPRFTGMTFQEATGLGDVKLNGKVLWEQLKSCAETGKSINSRSITYWGRAEKGADLFRPGDYRITVNPSRGPDRKISSLVMMVEALSFFGSARGLNDLAGNPDRLESILGTSARAFVLRDVLDEVYDPLTHLSAQLDLLFCKKEMGDKEAKTNKGDDNFGRDSLTDRTRLQGLAEDLCHRLALIRENIVLNAGGDSRRVSDINTCLSQAISMARSGGNGDKSISTFFDPDLPAVKADGRDLVLMFLIYLSMSKSCTAHVTDRTIHCATAKEKDHVVVRISHNGYIQRQDDLKAVFGKPLQSYFAEAGSVRPSETLLRYAGCLLNKHRVKMKLTNIPGHFELCFNIPTRKSGKNKT